MEYGRLFFNASTSRRNMLFLGNSEPIFRGSRTMEEISKKRLFFSSPEDLYDENYYDEQLPEKKRRLTSEQVYLLEKSFEAENKLEPDRKSHLAKKLGLQPRQVAVWFQNRRTRWKTKQLERDYDILKSSFHSLQSNYNSILKEHAKLKFEVASLTEKLQTKDVATGEKEEPLPAEMVSTKVEDHVSIGSARSAVVDGGNENPACIGPIQSEEDDRHSYFSNVFTTAEQPEETLGWWVWS